MNCTPSIFPVVALLSLGFVSCGTSPQAKEPAKVGTALAAREASQGTATIKGTAIDASTGLAVAGALIAGLDGKPVKTDEEGHFELIGLVPGASGFLTATTEAGWSGKNRIRPLDSGDLEVVIYLRPGR